MEVLLFNLKDESINRYYQWDSEQSIVLKSIDIGDDIDVHFCHSDSDKALVVRPYFQDGKTVVNVPNQLLQFAKPLVIYLYQVDSGTGNHTIYSTKIPVIPRPKPDTYVYTETEIIRYESLDSRILALEEAGNVELDPTLTESGKAADAAAVGAALKSIEFTDATDDGTGIITLGKAVQHGDGCGSYMVKVRATWDEEAGDNVYTAENFNWDELAAAIQQDKHVFCRLLYDDGRVKDFQLTVYYEEDTASFTWRYDAEFYVIDVDFDGSVGFNDYSQNGNAFIVEIDSDSAQANVGAGTIKWAALAGKNVFLHTGHIYVPLNHFDDHFAVFYRQCDDNVNTYYQINIHGDIYECDIN